MPKPAWVRAVEETPLISVVAEFVKLGPHNGLYVRGLCPFHDEKTESFSVSIKKNMAHCYGCGQHFHDAMGFVIKLNGFTRKEAFKWLLDFSLAQRMEKRKPRSPRKRYRDKKEYLKNKTGRPLW